MSVGKLMALNPGVGDYIRPGQRLRTRGKVSKSQAQSAINAYAAGGGFQNAPPTPTTGAPPTPRISPTSTTLAGTFDYWNRMSNAGTVPSLTTSTSLAGTKDYWKRMSNMTPMAKRPTETFDYWNRMSTVVPETDTYWRRPYLGGTDPAQEKASKDYYQQMRNAPTTQETPNAYVDYYGNVIPKGEGLTQRSATAYSARYSLSSLSYGVYPTQLTEDTVFHFPVHNWGYESTNKGRQQFLTDIGYAPVGNGVWKRLDPVQTTGGGGYATYGYPRSGGGGRTGGGAGNAGLVNWRIGF